MLLDRILQEASCKRIFKQAEESESQEITVGRGGAGCSSTFSPFLPAR
jgi:hypothetical protein